MKELEIYNKLEELRAGFDLTSEGVPSTVKVEIDGKLYEQRIWSELYESSKLFVFLLQTEKAIITNAYCLGLLVHLNGDTEQLSNAKMWEIGIP